MARSNTFVLFLLIAMFLLTLGLFVALFDPGLRYKMSTPSLAPASTEDFVHTVEALTDSRVFPSTRVTLLPNGKNFYEAELQAIRGARTSVNLEAYIFQRGEVTRSVLEASGSRARKCVNVNLVV